MVRNMEFAEQDYLMPFEVAGLKFRNQFVVASGPTTKNVGQLVEAERCGWGAASLKLAIEPPPYISLPPRYKWWKKQKYLAFSAETRLTLDEACRLAEEGRKNTKELILFANITYAGEKGMEGWIDVAKRCVDSGVHVIELNMCCPNMSFNLTVSGEGGRTPQTGASLGQNAELVSMATEIIVNAVDVPVFVKLTPEGGRIGDVAAACFEKGASVVGTTANRLAIPDFNIDNPMKGPWRLQKEPAMACFSGNWIKPLALRDVFEMRKKSGRGACILGTGGIRNHVDAIQFMMCGADMIGICTETMLRGYDFLPGLIRKLKQFMDEHGYESYMDFRDKVADAITPADRFTIQSGHAVVDHEVCTGCGRCVRIGHCYAVTIENEKAIIVPSDCTGCSTCMDVCPAGAISFQETE